jgi:DNA-binding MarR family transcriptional regulator
MLGTSEKLHVETTDDQLVLNNVLKHPGSTLSEIANTAKLLPPLTYEIVSNLRMKDLISVQEDENQTRRYSITDAGRERLGLPAPEAIAAAEDEYRQEEKLERSHFSGIKAVEALSDRPDTLTQEEQAELVLKAIDDKYRSLDGLKRRVGFAAWFDAEDLLVGMCMKHVIRKEWQGDLTAYFRYEDKPLRFWRIGDGRIDAEFDPSFMPRDETAKAEELSDFTRKMLYPTNKPGALVINDEVDDFDPDDEEVATPIGKPESAFETKAGAQNGTSSEVKKNATRASRGNYKKASPIDKAQLQQLAETEQNTKAIAAGLGVSQSHLYKEFDKVPTLRDIYDRGRRKFATSQGHTVEDIGGRPRKSVNRSQKQADRPATPAARTANGPDLDVDEVERLAREGYTAKQAAEHFGMTVFVFKNRLSGKTGPNKPIREAWYRGKGAADASNGHRTVATPVKVSHKKRDTSVDRKNDAESAKLEVAIDTLNKTQDRLNGVSPELVDHPAHYNQHPSGVECIDVVEHMSFNLGNAMKYIWRADEKGSPVTDIEKAIWYLEREKSRRERQAV